MNKVLIVAIFLVVTLGLAYVFVFPVNDSATKLSETAVSGVQGMTEIAQSNGSIVSAQTVIRDYNDSDIAATVLDKGNSTISNVSSIPNTANFDVITSSYDDYDNLVSVTYRLR